MAIKMEGVKEISNITEIRSIKQVWMEQPDSFPVFLEENQELFPRIGERQKKENQALAEEFSKRMQKKVRQRPKDGLREQWEKELEKEMEEGAAEFLGREKIVCL